MRFLTASATGAIRTGAAGAGAAGATSIASGAASERMLLDRFGGSSDGGGIGLATAAGIAACAGDGARASISSSSSSAIFAASSSMGSRDGDCGGDAGGASAASVLAASCAFLASIRFAARRCALLFPFFLPLLSAPKKGRCSVSSTSPPARKSSKSSDGWYLNTGTMLLLAACAAAAGICRFAVAAIAAARVDSASVQVSQSWSASSRRSPFPRPKREAYQPRTH